MIIVKLVGGLGNQMFQYSLGRRLSLARNVPLKLDLSWYVKDSSRSFALDAFDIKTEIASIAEVEKFVPPALSGLKKEMFYFLQNHLPYRYRRVITEPLFSYNPVIVNKTPKNAYLLGYWQSEKYFMDIDTLIHEDFTAIKPFSAVYHQWEVRIANQVAVSLHIRRGDYISDTRFRRKYFVCSTAYYIRAIEKLQQMHSNLTIYVFSDDIHWARQELPGSNSLKFVDSEEMLTDVEELLLMSRCNHHVISNSTFGWWGAWLNQKPDKIVIAPANWFIDRKLSEQSQDIIPENWIRM